MNTMTEDKIMRSQKQRKQQYYKQMLDQQINYNSRAKQEASRQSYRPDNDRNQSYYPKQNFNEPSNQNEGYLPPIRAQKGQNYNPEHPSMRQRSEEDKTQIYLKNCQYIIKNLRQLKQKRQKDQFLTMSTEPTPKDELSREPSLKKDVQYYPRNQYFSSQGKAYNKIYPIEPTQKYKQNLRNMQEDNFNKSYQNSNRNNRIKSLPQTIIKKHIVNKYQNQQKQEKNINTSQLAESSQSEIPHGFEQKRKLKPRYPVRQLSSGSGTPRNHSKRLQSREKQRDVQQKQQQRLLKEEENAKVQKQLVFCLTELTKFLKNQNANKAEDKKEEKQSNVINQLKTKQSEDNSEQKAQEKPKQENQEQLNKTKQDNQKVQDLKFKAIVALKKLNSKSKQFMEFASGRTHHEKPKQEETAKKRPSVKFANEVEEKSSKQSKVNPQNAQNPNEEKALPKSIIVIPVKIPISFQPQQSVLQTDKAQKAGESKAQQNQLKQQNVNSQLAKQLISYLQKQQNQNFQLSFCLKQLTEYLKIQNEEMNQLKTSRQAQQQEKAQRKSLSPKKEMQQQALEEEQEKEAQKAQVNKLQEAVLKKLKKARLRGNIFKQKVQKFRKEHHLIITKKQTTQNTQKDKQEENQVQINPITVASNDLKEIRQNDEKEQEQKQSPIASQQKKTLEPQANEPKV